MSTLSEIGLTAARELRRTLRSPKGIAMGTLFFLGGTGGSLIYFKATRYALEQMAKQFTKGEAIPPEALHELKLQALQKAFDDGTARYLVDCPSMLMFLFQGTLMAIPLLALLSGFDVVSGETQHRTLRYLVGRASRQALVMGKALGLWVLVGLMMLLLHATVWVAALINQDGTAAQIATWGPKLWALALSSAACYAGVTTLLSSIFRTPAVALFGGVASLAAMGVLGVILRFIPSAETLSYILPGKYDGMLLSHSPAQALGAVGALLAGAALSTGVAAEIIRRRDV